MRDDQVDVQTDVTGGEPSGREPAVPPRWRTILALGLTGMAAVVVWGFAVRGRTGEMAVVIWLDQHHAPVLDAVTSAISWAVQPPRAILICALLAGVIAWSTGLASTGLGFGLAWGLAWGSCFLVKLLVNRPRPDWALLDHHVTGPERDPSFPSGHVSYVSTAVAVLLLITGPGRRRVWVGIIGILATLAMAGTRVYVGVHYPSDAMAGLVYGLCAGAVMYIAVAAVATRTELTGRTDRAAAPALARLHGRGAL
ncbi:MAG: phosphatase PAP2 family protein [Acidipropionibacterium sp.]|nr:phosphatase PAP2 family protein [Acidipropionibacterium sp.]